MTVAHVLQSAFSVSIGKSIQIPAGTRTMAFFGTGGDGLETNRAPGGPALSVTSGVPVHGSNFVSVGHQPAGAPTRFDVVDTGVAYDSATFTAGFTWACVARSQLESNNYNQCMGMQTAASGQGFNNSGICLWSGNRAVLYQGGNRAVLQLATSVTTNWHFLAFTSSGGSAPTWNLYEFTENQAGQVVSYSGLSGLIAIPAMTTHFGQLSVEAAVTNGPVDVAFGYVGTGPMSQANLAALAASVRPYLARRGISM
jgi:hypothetical protein